MDCGRRCNTGILIAALFVQSLAGVPANASAPGPTTGAPESPDGIWTGAADLNGQKVPFTLEVLGSGDRVHGNLVNGNQKSPSTSGSYAGGHLILHFDYYANTFDLTLNNGSFSGTFGREGHRDPVTGSRNASVSSASPNAPTIAGTWRIAVEGLKGEDIWTMRVHQHGAHVSAVIERIDGDTGALYGTWRNGAFAVSHFTPAGPSYVVLRPQPDGTLHLVTFAHDGVQEILNARRVDAADPLKRTAADDPMRHTVLRDPRQPLRFRFPDLQGKLVSSSDPEFHHKVVIVSIGGSWCPNCQDEAPFLEALYRRYHDGGLEVVELSFEEPDQLRHPVRLQAVIHRFGLTYPVLLAGTPDQLDQAFPGVANLNCWPTTFFVGRDGLVKAIHTGYSGPATGKDNVELERETVTLVQRLLAGKDQSDYTR